jgi:hypothetical protein
MKNADRRLFLVPPALALFAQMHSSRSRSAQTVSDANNDLGNVKVSGVRVVQIDSTHVCISVDLIVIPTKMMRIESLRLSSLRMNGLAVYAKPLNEPIELTKGEETQLPPFCMTAPIEDLTAISSLSQMVKEQVVHVEGMMIATVGADYREPAILPGESIRLSQSVTADASVHIERLPQQSLVASDIPAFRNQLPARQSISTVQTATRARTTNYQTAWSVNTIFTSATGHLQFHGHNQNRVILPAIPGKMIEVHHHIGAHHAWN